ncbi:glycosyltransferase [Candidatus Roizmanbacteria bacterium]|nr:glycosyltransferase [Candidatus Roizmanbacteria bacterium]
MLTVSVIIPAYNEEKTVGRVLSVLVSTPGIDEIICVNDGSTDRTGEIVRSFLKVRLISFRKNKGKSDAIGEGIRKASGDIVVFLDADLEGLNSHHVAKLTRPLIERKADAVIGYCDSFLDPLLLPISGQRAYVRKDLLPHVRKLENKGYGLELFLNSLYTERRVHIVKLTGVGHITKYRKQSYPDSIKLTLSEWHDLAKELASQDNGGKSIFSSYLSRLYQKSSSWFVTYKNLFD